MLSDRWNLATARIWRVAPRRAYGARMLPSHIGGLGGCLRLFQNFVVLDKPSAQKRPTGAIPTAYVTNPPSVIIARRRTRLDNRRRGVPAEMGTESCDPA